MSRHHLGITCPRLLAPHIAKGLGMSPGEFFSISGFRVVPPSFFAMSPAAVSDGGGRRRRS
eukprot:6231622-Pyramimonas_sp.AAC.1